MDFHFNGILVLILTSDSVVDWRTTINGAGTFTLLESSLAQQPSQGGWTGPKLRKDLIQEVCNVEALKSVRLRCSWI
jgi:hypothetical protein